MWTIKPLLLHDKYMTSWEWLQNHLNDPHSPTVNEIMTYELYSIIHSIKCPDMMYEYQSIINEPLL